MPVKITYEHLNSPTFAEALSVLGEAKTIADKRTAYTIGKFIRTYAKNLQVARGEYMQILSDAVERDENNMPIKDEESKNALIPFKIKEDKKEEFLKRATEFFAKEVEIPVNPLRVEDLAGVEITPVQLATLEVLFN